MDLAVLARLYHRVLSALVADGGAPHYTERARRLGLTLEDTRLALHQLASLGLPIWLHPGTDLLAATGKHPHRQRALKKTASYL